MMLQDLNLFPPILAHTQPAFDRHFLAASNDLQTGSTAATAKGSEPTQDLNLALPFRVHLHPAVRHFRAVETAAHTGVGGAVGVAVGAAVGPAAEVASVEGASVGGSVGDTRHVLSDVGVGASDSYSSLPHTDARPKQYLFELGVGATFSYSLPALHSSRVAHAASDEEVPGTDSNSVASHVSQS